MALSVFLPPLEMPLELVKGFSVIIARHTSQRREIERALLILELIKFNPSETARRLGCNREKAYRWYHRANKLPVLLSEHSDMTDVELERFLRAFLKDNERSGAPLIYSPEQQCAIVAMASEKPRRYGVEADNWTHRELSMVANRDGISTSISASTVGRILNEADIKPHRSKYWEFPNIEDMAILNPLMSLKKE